MKKSDSNRGEERLTEVRRSRNCQKGGEGRLGEDRRRDGSTRRRRTSLEMESRHRKVGHAPTHGTQATGEEWCVDDCFSVGFPSTCRSALCALESDVSDRRRAGRKKSLAAKRSNSGGDKGGFRKENKVTGRKHGHRKRN